MAAVGRLTSELTTINTATTKRNQNKKNSRQPTLFPPHIAIYFMTMRGARFLLQNVALATGYIFKPAARQPRSFLLPTLRPAACFGPPAFFSSKKNGGRPLRGWVQDDDGEWNWQEDDPNYVPPAPTATVETPVSAVATPQLQLRSPAADKPPSPLQSPEQQPCFRKKRTM